RRAESARVDLVVHERRGQRDRTAAIARRGGVSAKVAGQHGRVRHISKYLGWSAPCFRSLESSEYEELVLHNRSADRAAVLIALQTIAAGRKRIPRVEDSIPHKFKEVSMEGVGSGFRHQADFTS